MAQNEVMAMELTEKVTVEDTVAEELASEEAEETEESEAVEVKDIYCRFYCYDGTES